MPFFLELAIKEAGFFFKCGLDYIGFLLSEKHALLMPAFNIYLKPQVLISDLTFYLKAIVDVGFLFTRHSMYL